MSEPTLHGVEIGAGDSHSSQLLPHAARFARLELYEPNAILFADLAAEVATLGNPKIRAIHAAITLSPAPLVHLGYASYLTGRPSFLHTSCEPGAEKHWAALTKEVPTLPMSAIDDGTIDSLVLTNNGGEIPALLTMRSRPETIWTKHYCHRPEQWEEAHHVFGWMQGHGYAGKVIGTNQHGTFIHAMWERVQS